MLSSRLDSEGQSESKSQSGSAQVPSASPNDDLAELLKSTLKALSESTDKDAFSLEAVLSREIEGQCEQALKREGFSVDVAKSWRAALAELIEDLDPNDHDDSFSLPRVVQEIVQYLKTSAPELEAKYDGSRTGYWQTALSNFLESYKEHGGIRSSRSYEALSKVVEAKCQFILKPKSDLDQNAIIHQVSSRTKTFKSLSKKAKKATDTLARTVIFDCDKLFPEEVTDDLPEGLPDEWPEEQAVKWAKNLLVENIRDLAGIRILVYFPDDVPKVVKAIMGDSGLKIKEGTVSFTKSRIDHRKKDQEALKTFQKDGGDLASMLNYSDGAFFSEPVSLNNVAQRWKHSGYRAVHLHVEVTDEVGEQWDATRHNLMRNDPQLRTTAEIEGRGNATGNAEESATDNDEEEVLDEAATESAEESATDSDEEEVLDEAATDSAEESATDSDDEEVPDEAATDSAEESATDSDEEEVPNEPNKRGGDEHLLSRSKFDIKLDELKRKFPEIKSRHLLGKLAEIQITTVVMHAWSQVEHDIIYKNPFKIPLNGTMTRMLDGINGLSLTSEIMLEELQRTTAQIKDSMNQRFSTNDEQGLLARLKETYLRNGDESPWHANLSWVRVLHHVVFRRFHHFFSAGRDHPPRTLASLQKFVPEFDNINSTTSKQFRTSDISVAILKAAGLAKEKKSLMRIQGDDARCFRRLLLFSNSLSIMLVMNGYFVFKQLKQRVPWGEDVAIVIEKANRINDCLLNSTRPRDLHGLGEFAEKFLMAEWCDLHDVAVALARHSFFLKEAGLDSAIEFQPGNKLSFVSNFRVATVNSGGFDCPPVWEQIDPEFLDFVRGVRPLKFTSTDTFVWSSAKSLPPYMYRFEEYPIPEDLSMSWGERTSSGQLVLADSAKLKTSLSKLDFGVNLLTRWSGLKLNASSSNPRNAQVDISNY